MVTSAIVAASTGPLTPCGPPQPGASVATTVSTASTSLVTSFDSESVVISVGGFVLMLALVAMRIVRRLKCGRIGWRIAALVLLSIAFAAFAAAWVWQLRASISGGCAIYINAAPFSDGQAVTLAPVLTLLVCALAVVWIVAAVATALRRTTASA